MNKSESIKNIAGALLVAQKNMGDATKGSKNPFFKSSYADLNSIREAAIPALNAQGIAVLQPTDATAGVVETLLLHVSGEWISGTTKIVNTKGDAQGEGSGVSYARRYGLQSLLNIGAVDDDGEASVGRKHETKTTVQTAEVRSTVSGSNGTHTPRTEKQDEAKTQTKATTTATKKISKEDVAEAFKKLEAAKKVTKDTFKAKYLSGAGLSTINETQVQIAALKINNDFPGTIV